MLFTTGLGLGQIAVDVVKVFQSLLSVQPFGCC